MKNEEMKIKLRDFSWTSPFKWGFPQGLIFFTFLLLYKFKIQFYNFKKRGVKININNID